MACTQLGNDEFFLNLFRVVMMCTGSAPHCVKLFSLEDVFVTMEVRVDLKR